jgi:hypothetical protein
MVKDGPAQLIQQLNVTLRAKAYAAGHQLDQNGCAVFAAQSGARIERLPALHPALSLLEHLLGVWLAYNSLTGAKPPYIDDLPQILRHLPQPVTLVVLRLEVDSALGTPQSTKVLLDIVDAGIFRNAE